ncbi:carbon-nitrogen hydrolase family protein [Phenylobacterium deserti]|uniref:Carbon-nitrogen hydrolase family protein n=1 Tax=Phenylobacterium deserti TaxID=1914756 RepID=A0A328ADM0_9CAUL|nr:carbon-nitrogen hydrolase family protein [Phenylobacterium deserti]RAK51504.1 carbon-nitrogen hydrolase family protein [Phenylobacterium deserti]
MKVGLIQTRTPATPQAALSHVLPLVREAAGQGARLIVTPEGTNVLQRDRSVLWPMLRALEDDPVVRGLREAACELGVWILIGSALVLRADGKAANRAALISPDGALIATYDKMHMFDVDLPTGQRIRESEAYEPGDRAVVVQAGDLKLGLSICYDLRFPALFRALAAAGAQVLTVPSAFTRPTGEAHWEVLLRARAIETGSFVLAPAQGGEHEDGRATWGRSMIVGPWGQVVGHLDHDEPGVLVAALDLEDVAKARQAIPALKNAREFQLP